MDAEYKKALTSTNVWHEMNWGVYRVSESGTSELPEDVFSTEEAALECMSSRRGAEYSGNYRVKAIRCLVVHEPNGSKRHFRDTPELDVDQKREKARAEALSALLARLTLEEIELLKEHWEVA